MFDSIKSFLVGALIVLGLLVVGALAVALDPTVGLALGLALLIVPGLAVYRPIPALGLTHKGFCISVAVFAGLITTFASVGDLGRTQELATLRETDPDAYLAEIESDKDLWLKELKALAPERYAAEQAKADAARKAADAAKARLAAEQAEAQRAQQEQAAAGMASAYVDQLDREIAGLQSFDARKYTQSQSSLAIGVAVFSVWAKLYDEGRNLTLSETQEQRRQVFRQNLIAAQRKALPVLRDQYGPIMRKELWEHDASARTFGTGFTTVEFVAAAFAANRNIKTFQDSAFETLQTLRFKRAQYKWFKGARKFTYYDLKSLPDDALVIWTGNGRYRRVD